MNYDNGNAIRLCLPVFIFPKSVHLFNDLLRPYTFEEYDSSSVPPPTRLHAISDVERPLLVIPPIMMMDCVEPMVQLE